MKPLQNDLILMTFPLFTSESRQWAICRHSWLSKSWEHAKQTGPLSLNRGYPKMFLVHGIHSIFRCLKGMVLCMCLWNNETEENGS